MEWKDTTTYSRDDRDRIPTTWSADVADLRITVTCGHIHHRGEWVMHFRPWFECHPIGKVDSVTEEQAKVIAVARARAKVDAVYLALRDR